MMGLFYASTISFAHVELVDISENRDWKIEEIAQTIEKYHNMQGPKRKIRVAFLAHHPFFNAKGFDLAALLSGHDFQIKYPEQNEYANAIASISDYVIYKTGYQFPDPIHPTTKRYFSIPEAGKKFERICEFDLPDGKAILYRRIP